MSEKFNIKKIHNIFINIKMFVCSKPQVDSRTQLPGLLTEVPAFQQLSYGLCYRWYFDIAKTIIDGF